MKKYLEPVACSTKSPEYIKLPKTEKPTKNSIPTYFINLLLAKACPYKDFKVIVLPDVSNGIITGMAHTNSKKELYRKLM